MNLKRITRTYYPPVSREVKKNYLIRQVEELEAEEEIDEYDGTIEADYPSGREWERYSEM